MMSAMYKSIIASDLLERQGGTYRVRMRLKEGDAGPSAVLEIQAAVQTPRVVAEMLRSRCAVFTSVS
jgi:hypothetical protein